MAQKKVVKGEIVHLDYHTLANTRYEDCKLIYKGGIPPNLAGNEFIRCTFIFENEAANTQEFMRVLYAAGARELVMEMIGAKDGN